MCLGQKHDVDSRSGEDGRSRTMLCRVVRAVDRTIEHTYSIEDNSSGFRLMRSFCVFTRRRYSSASSNESPLSAPVAPLSTPPRPQLLPSRNKSEMQRSLVVLARALSMYAPPLAHDLTE